MNDAMMVLIISTVVGLISTIFWRWVSTVSDGSMQTIMDGLKEIKVEVKEVGNKLDKKADKT